MKPWFLLSNRPKHIGLGLCVYLAAWGFALLVGLGWGESSVMAFMAVTVCGVTKEYTDRLHGCAFDVLDALATVVLPFVITLFTVVIRLLWLY